MDLEKQLRAALVACEPGPEPMAAVMGRLSRRRGPAPIIILGSVVTFAVAAAVLVTRVADTPVARQVTSVQSPESARGSAVTIDAPLLMSELPALVPQSASPEPVAAVKPFTVTIQLQNQAKGDAALAVESFYGVLLDNLRAIPGITLIESVPGAAAAGNKPDHRLVVIGKGPVANARFAITILEDPIEVPNAGTASKSEFGSTGSVADPLAIVDSIMDRLRSRVLPPDPTYKQRLQAQLLDSRQDLRLRMKALADLGTFGRSPAGGSAMPLDTEVVRGAIDLAASTSDPAMRAQIWRMLRGTRNADLVPSLVGSLRDDAGIDVRLEALATLNADFRDDPRARGALESMARDEQRPLLRAIAQRALTGDAGWKQYIASSLQDTTRPVADRVEAYAYQVYGTLPGKPGGGVGNFRILDDEMIQALSQVLPQAAGQPGTNLLPYNTYSHLMSIGNPAGVSLAINTAIQATEPGIRSDYVDLLVRYSDDPRVRAALERISTDDPDRVRRQTAAEVLKSAPPPGG